MDTLRVGPVPEGLVGELPLRRADLTAGTEVDVGLAVGGLDPQGQLGELRRQSLGLGAGDRPAPFDRPVAVCAHLAPVDTERGALPAVDPGQPLIADDADELLAERPQARFADVALQAQQAALRHLPGHDLVHDNAPSGEPVDEGGDQCPLPGVPFLGFLPERHHPRSHLGGSSASSSLTVVSGTPTWRRAAISRACPSWAPS